MARDDWRLRIELGDEGAGGLLGRLGLAGTGARHLEQGLDDQHLAATRDGGTVFVYANSSLALEQARAAIDRELAEIPATPESVAIEHWLADEERWDDEPSEQIGSEDKTLAAGYAPWEVRIPCRSREAAHELADRLEQEGYGVVRRFRYVIAGTATREDAQALAAQLHGEVEPGGELVYEERPANPFRVFGAVFGGLGADGTPL